MDVLERLGTEVTLLWGYRVDIRLAPAAARALVVHDGGHAYFVLDNKYKNKMVHDDARYEYQATKDQQSTPAWVNSIHRVISIHGINSLIS